MGERIRYIRREYLAGGFGYNGDLSIRQLVGGVLEIILSELMRAIISL